MGARVAMMTKLTNNLPPVGDAGRGVSPAAERKGLANATLGRRERTDGHRAAAGRSAQHEGLWFWYRRH